MFLRVPLFYKLVVGNAALVLAAGVAGTLLGDPAAGLWGAATVALCLVLLLSIGLNAAIVSVALRPLRDLEEAARRVQAGDLGARAAVSRVADRELRRLIEVFNDMLETVEALRGRHRALTLRALDAAERECDRVARRLYDGTAQELSALLVGIERAHRSAAPAEELREIREAVVGVLEDVRSLARGLRAPELRDLGLLAAVRAHGRLEARTGGTVEVRGVDPPVSAEVRVALYRMIQAALSILEPRPDPRVELAAAPGGDDVRVTISARELRGGEGPAALEQATEELFALGERAALLGGTVSVGRDGERLSVGIRIDEPGAGGAAGDVLEGRPADAGAVDRRHAGLPVHAGRVLTRFRTGSGD